MYKGNTYETTQYFNNCRKGSYNESFCGTLPERSSIPSGKTCFVPLLLSGKKKSNRQEKIRENYWISHNSRGGSFYLSWTMLHNKTRP